MINFHTKLEVRTHFESSSTVITAIQRNAVEGQLSNSMSVPTDCDQVRYVAVVLSSSYDAYSEMSASAGWEMQDSVLIRML